MFELAKSHASFPCSELQILTPKVSVYSSESWLAIFLSIHIKTKGGSIESEQKLETVSPPNCSFSLKVTSVTPAANLRISSLKRSFEATINFRKRPIYLVYFLYLDVYERVSFRFI